MAEDLQDKAFIKMTLDNALAFESAIHKAVKKCIDLSEPFDIIADDFYKSEQAIFNLKSPGGYRDFKSEKSRQSKLRAVGFAYPLLKRSGRLQRSVTQRGDGEGILRINSKYMIIGTSVPYGIFHNSDEPRKKIPQRKFLFIGPESREFANKQWAGGRLVRWVGTIEGHVAAVLKDMKT